jgi:hypothetical protein
VVIVIVDVDVDIVVVCGAVGVVVVVVVVVIGSDDVVAAVVVSGFLGARTTNINTRERVNANIVRTIKDIEMILTQQWCHHFCGSIFLVASSLYSRL